MDDPLWGIILPNETLGLHSKTCSISVDLRHNLIQLFATGMSMMHPKVDVTLAAGIASNQDLELPSMENT